MKIFARTLVLIFALNLPALKSTQAQNCSYETDPKNLKVEWSGYKFTEKTPAKGQFKTHTMTFDKKRATRLPEFIETLSAEVDLSSVWTDNPGRDHNLRTSFFELLRNHAKTRGHFTHVKFDEGSNEGQAKFHLVMNQVRKIFPAKLTKQKSDTGEDTILAVIAIDVLKFSAKKQLKKLSELCKDVHRGTDGKSKTWSDAEIRITLPFRENCGS